MYCWFDEKGCTFDFWTSITNKPYIVITAHFIHKSKLSAIILDLGLIPYPHTSDQILTKIKQIFDTYGLQHKIISITTDNESTNVKLMQLMSLFYIEYEHVIRTRCLAHILNLTVKKGLKKLREPVSDISKLVNTINFSPKKKQLYTENCELLNMSPLALLKEMPIRWNSTFLMLERAYRMRLVLDHVCTKNEELQKHLIKEWDQAKQIIDFLKPFYDATLLLSKSKYPSLIYVVPIIDILMTHISSHYNHDFLKGCANEMTDKLTEYSSLLRTDYALYAVILDPRLKNTYFSNLGQQQPLESFKLFFKSKYVQLNSTHNQPLEVPSTSNNIFNSIYTTRPTVRDELQEYLVMPVEPEATDVCDWWVKQGSRFPQLQKFAFHILSIPATSVPSEQSFSKSGDLITKKRNLLGNKSIQASMCLASWLSFFDDNDNKQ